MYYQEQTVPKSYGETGNSRARNGNPFFSSMGDFRMKRSISIFAALLIACLSYSVTANANPDPIFLVDGSGRWIGADDVVIKGNVYDLSFAQGTCAAAFGACDPSKFTFDTSNGAFDATLTVQNLATEGGFTNSNGAVLQSGIISGCPASSPFCDIITPYQVGFAWDADFNNFPQGGGQTEQDFFSPTIPFSSGQIWAVWTPALSSVPEPSALAGLFAGLLALGVIRRRSKTY